MEYKPKPAVMVDGQPWWDFLYEYDMDGASFGFTVRATSREDAEARMRKIALARFVGQADGLPVPMSRGGFLVPLVVWLRNLTA